MIYGLSNIRPLLQVGKEEKRKRKEKKGRKKEWKKEKIKKGRKINELGEESRKNFNFLGSFSR